MVFILASEHLDKHLLVWQDITASDLMKVRSHYRPSRGGRKIGMHGFFQTSRNYHEFTKIFDAHNVDYDSKLPTTNSRSNDVLSTETSKETEAPFMDDHNAPADLSRMPYDIPHSVLGERDGERIPGSDYEAE
jgi:hypothetical protein